MINRENPQAECTNLIVLWILNARRGSDAVFRKPRLAESWQIRGGVTVRSDELIIHHIGSNADQRSAELWSPANFSQT